MYTAFVICLFWVYNGNIMNINQIAKKGSARAEMVYHENPDIFHVNTLENHCYFIPFGKEKAQNPFGYLKTASIVL